MSFVLIGLLLLVVGAIAIAWHHPKPKWYTVQLRQPAITTNIEYPMKQATRRTIRQTQPVIRLPEKAWQWYCAMRRVHNTPPHIEEPPKKIICASRKRAGILTNLECVDTSYTLPRRKPSSSK